MTYNQDFINIYGEMIVQNWLLMDRKTIKESYLNIINNKESPGEKEDILKIIAFENYCLKYAKHTKTKLEQNIMDSFLEFLADEFINDPITLNGSLLLKEENVKQIYKGEKLNKILKTRKQMNEKAKIAMLKHAKGEKLNEEEKDYLMIYYIANIDTQNINLKRIMEKYISDLLNMTDENRASKNELLFLGNFATRYMIKLYNNEHKTQINIPQIYIIKTNDNECSIYLKDHMFINYDNKASKSIPSFLKAIFHETKHSIQSYNALHDKTKEALEWIQNELFLTNIKNTENTFSQNHHLLSIEKDAEKEGFNYAKLFYLCYGKEGKDTKGLAKLFRGEKISKKELEDAFCYRQNEDGEIIPKEYYNTKNLNEIIYKHPKLLRKYPVLSSIYEKNGEAKNIIKFLTKNGKTKDIKNNEIYNDYIINDIFNGKLLHIKIKYYNEKDEANIFSNLINIFVKRLETITKMINALKHGNITEINDHDILIIGNYHTTVAIKILEFLNRNKETINVLEKEGILNIDYYNSYTLKNEIDEFNNFLNTKFINPQLENIVEALKKVLETQKLI